jgi:NAD(P)-dependent dehydrogenase (short-subunit alcohol dehydrogenase family)
MKRILVTGSNKGIGLAIVRRLLEDYSDTVVLLCSRDRSRGLAAVDSLINQQRTWADRLHFIPLDVNSSESGL